jgi:hypothetical protein
MTMPKAEPIMRAVIKKRQLIVVFLLLYLL